MKKDRQKKLTLNRETLKALTPRQLVDAAGGGVGNPLVQAQDPFPSMCSCCITECCC